ncbi:MAG TPA: hypothetical protein VJA94_06485 [Candidatus Angelobacter sp.]
MAQTSCPYVGLQPYTEDDRQFFFGREREQRIISSNLYASPLTVVYGASGVGKSSILRAGVMPYLQSSERTTVVYFNQWQDPSFTEKLKVQCLDAVARSTTQRPSVDIKKSLGKFLTSLAKESGCALLILLDQFEEYFLYHPENNDRSNFDGEFASAVNQTQAELGFMIAMRDDWLSRLDRFQRRIPNLLGNTYRLDHLTSAAAEDAIRKPLDVYNQAQSNGGPVLVEDQLVQEILGQVRAGEVNLSDSQGTGQAKVMENGDRIETAFLQLVMTRLWTEEMKAGSSKLRVATLRQLGGAKQIVQSHLDNVLSSLTGPQQEMCANMFRYLVTPRGSKIAHETADLVAFAEYSAEEVKPLLEKLADPRTHLLRRLSQPERYEIFHDVLGQAILEWRARYQQEQQRVEYAKKAEAEAERKNANRFRRLSFALAILFLVAVITAAYAWRLQIQANASAKDATLQKNKAQDNEQKAEDARSKAIDASAYAAFNETKAEEASREAAKQARLARSQQMAAEALVALTDGGSRDTSILLASEAARITLEKDGTVLPDVEEALRRTILINPIELMRPGHSKPVSTMAFSPNGNLLVSSGTDNTIRVWDATSGKELNAFAGIQCTASPAIVFSSNGDSIVCANLGDLRVWNSKTFQEVARLSPCGKSFVQQFALTPDGQSVIAGCSDATIRFWDLSGKSLTTLSGRNPVLIESGRRLVYLTPKSINFRDMTTGQEQSIATSSASMLTASTDGNHIAVRSTGGSITLFDTKSLSALASFTDNSARYLAISPDGSRAATYDGGTQVKLWNLAHHDSAPIPIALPSEFRPFSPSLFFSPDGSTLVLRPGLGATPEPGKQDVRFWNATSGSSTLGSGWTAVAFSPDGGRRALASLSSLKIFDSKNLHPPQTLYDHEASFSMAAFSPDGDLVAIATIDNSVHLWNRHTGQHLAELGQQSLTIQDLEFSPDGQLLASASSDGSVKVWDIATRKERFTRIPEPGVDGRSPGEALGAVFSGDSKRLATSSTNLAQVWDARSGAPLTAPIKPKNGGRVGDVAFAPGGHRLVIIGNQMEFWDISSSQPKFIDQQPKLNADATAYSVIFTADGRHLVAPANAGMWVWETAAKRWRSLPGGLTGADWLGVAISPDKKTVAGPGPSGTIILWNLQSGEEQTTLYAGKEVLKALAYSPDGNTLYTLAADWKLYAHPAPLSLVLREAQRQIANGRGPKELNRQNCQQLLHEPCPQEVLALNKSKVSQVKKSSSR